MLDKKIYLIFGIIIGVIVVIIGNYLLDFYTIDWGATGTWGLLFLAIVALIVAYQQIIENRRLKKIEVDHARKLQKLEVTQAYLSDTRKLVIHGTLNEAIKKVKYREENGQLLSYDLDIQTVIYFFEELGIMYKEDMIDHKLIRIMTNILAPRTYDEMFAFIQAAKKSSGGENMFKNWEYLVEQVRSKDTPK